MPSTRSPEIVSPENATAKAWLDEYDFGNIDWDGLLPAEQRFLTLISNKEFDQAAKVLSMAKPSAMKIAQLYNLLEVFHLNNKEHFSWTEIFEHPAIMKVLNLKSVSRPV